MGCLVQARVAFLRAIGRSMSRSCAGTIGANPKLGSSADISGLGSKCDGKLRSVTREEETCIGVGTQGGLPEAFREPLPRALVDHVLG